MDSTLHDLAYSDALLRWRLASDRQSARGIVQRTAELLGVSESTVYRRLQELRHGRAGAGRAPRSDHGTSEITEEERAALVQILARGLNKRGEPNIPLSEAVEIARQKGHLQADLSVSQIARQLRRHGQGLAALRAPEAAVWRASSYPNHVWLADVSVCVQWYLRDAGGQKVTLRDDLHTGGLYEGKLERSRELREVLHRYLACDHFSGAFYVRYYYAGGENAVDACDFLFRSMAPKRNPSAYPFRGIPYRMVLDRGPAWKNGIVQTLLKELGLPCDGDDKRVEYHQPGNPKASGSVEKAHDLWQRRFEGKLAVQGGFSLDELNGWAEQACGVINAERTHTRTKRTRSALWATITTKQLREAPDRQTYLALAATKRREGTLTNRLWLRADSQVWELKGGVIFAGAKVTYALAPFLDVGLRAWDAEGSELACTKLDFDAAGFATNGRGHRWDDEEKPGASAPRTPAQTIAHQVREGVAPALDLDGLFADMGERLERHAFLSRPGQAWTAPAGSALAASPVLSDLDARDEIVARAGRRLDASEWSWWASRIGDGITRDQLEAAWAEFTSTSIHTQAVSTA